MTHVSRIELKLRSPSKSNSEIKRKETNLKQIHNKSFDIDKSKIHESINIKVVIHESNPKKFDFNRVRLQRKGSLYNKSNDNPNRNVFDQIINKPSLPSFTNQYLKNYMEYKDSSEDKQIKNLITDEFEEPIEIKSIKNVEHYINIEHKKKGIRLPKIQIHNMNKNLQNIEDLGKIVILHHSKITINQTFSRKSEFDVDENDYRIDRFNKHHENELISQLNSKIKRITKSLNINPSNANQKKISSMNYFQSIKMAKKKNISCIDK